MFAPILGIEAASPYFVDPAGARSYVEPDVVYQSGTETRLGERELLTDFARSAFARRVVAMNNLDVRSDSAWGPTGIALEMSVRAPFSENALHSDPFPYAGVALAQLVDPTIPPSADALRAACASLFERCPLPPDSTRPEAAFTPFLGREGFVGCYRGTWFPPDQRPTQYYLLVRAGLDAGLEEACRAVARGAVRDKLDYGAALARLEPFRTLAAENRSRALAHLASRLQLRPVAPIERGADPLPPGAEAFGEYPLRVGARDAFTHDVRPRGGDGVVARYDCAACDDDKSFVPVVLHDRRVDAHNLTTVVESEATLGSAPCRGPLLRPDTRPFVHLEAVAVYSTPVATTSSRSRFAAYPTDFARASS